MRSVQEIKKIVELCPFSPNSVTYIMKQNGGKTGKFDPFFTIRLYILWNKTEAEVKEKLLEVNITGLNATAVTELALQSEQKIAKAREAFNETKFGEAFGLANAAEQLAKNAEKILERILELEEEEEEKEIEVEIEKGIAKVKVKIAGNKLRYSIPFATEDGLFNDIASRTGLSLEEVKALAEIEIKEEEAKGEEAEEGGKGRSS